MKTMHNFMDLEFPEHNGRLSIVETIVDYIRQMIANGELSPGDKIPTEIELCSILNVSRGSVREAIKVLEALGVIEIRRGEGTYISKLNNIFILTPLMFKMLLNNVTLSEMLDFRWEIEYAVMRLAIQNATDEQLLQIKRSIQKQIKLLNQTEEGTMEQRFELETEFHNLLSRATNNMIMQEVYGFTMHMLSTMLKNITHMGHTWATVVDIHSTTYEAIKKKDDLMIKAQINRLRNAWIEWLTHG